MAELNNCLTMTTCKCRDNTTNLVMTRGYLEDLIQWNKLQNRLEVIDKVIDLLDVHREVWFHQSLTAGSATFWNNKVATVQQLMNELEEMKCQS